MKTPSSRTFLFFCLLSLLISNTICYSISVYADEYVPGMSCREVGDFAQTVLIQKQIGETLNDQIIGLRQSLNNKYKDTQDALEKIIHAIYSSKSLSSVTPKSVGSAYEHACELVEHK